MVKKILFLLFSVFLFIFSTIAVYADTSSGMQYLQSKQDSTGKITGFGGESQWAAFAFAENGVDISTVKNSGISLKDFLLADKPAEGSSATEWERRILAIVAIGGDPTNFGGVNYVQNVEALANNNQLGETSLLNDDIFGLLALIASGSSAQTEVKQMALNFIISKQNADGGFSWSTNPDFNTSDSNDTAAAIQALQAAKENQLTHKNLNAAIEKAKNYVLSLQVENGGFKYDTSAWSTDPDSASTAWALMALNSLDLEDSSEATKAKTWLNAQQESDGGFHWMSGSGSDTATTSYALIALSGNGVLFAPPSVQLSPVTTVSVTQQSSTTAPVATTTPTVTPATTCQNAKPGTPVITGATIGTNNEVTLSWNKISDGVSYYLLAYGTSSNNFEYGNPHIGGKDATSYTVTSLNPGKTYYFKIRAGNGCATGEFSNSAVVNLSTSLSPSISPTLSPTVPTGIPTMQPEEAVEEPKVLGFQTTQQSGFPFKPVFFGVSLLSFLSAIAYWHFKLRS